MAPAPAPARRKGGETQVELHNTQTEGKKLHQRRLFIFFSLTEMEENLAHCCKFGISHFEGWDGNLMFNQGKLESFDLFLQRKIFFLHFFYSIYRGLSPA